MRIVVLLLAASLAPGQVFPGPVLTVTPAVITQCVNGLGHAVLDWNSPLNGQVQIRVGARDGTPMTGLEAPSGSAETGDWVRDGMPFFLVNSQGQELARVTARVNCGGTPDTTASAFTAATSYFPLQLGNRWVYRTDSRLETSGWLTWTLTRTVELAGQTWFVLETRTGSSVIAAETLYRAGEDGKVYRIPGYPDQMQEELWLDPNGGPDSPAVAKTKSRGTVATPFGPLPGMEYRTGGSLAVQTGTLVRGLGLLDSTSTSITGSSGGFAFGLSLVEARIGQGVYYTTPSCSITVAAERARLNVTGKEVTNCAVPCYYAACGIAPGADPPNTWKPCFQARVRAGVAGVTDALPLEATLELISESGASVYEKTLGLTAVRPAGEAVAYTQVPLYSAPNAPLPTGAYRVRVTVRSGGAELGSASAAVTVE